MKIKVPNKLQEIFFTKKRYIMLHGGRSGGKSHSAAAWCCIKIIQEGCRILCTREVQTSISQSVHKLISDTIYKCDLPGFTVTEKSIKHCNGGEFIFMGIRGGSKQESITRLKSLENIKYCWIEEAQGLIQESIDLLDPTIRAKGAQIVATFNRYTEQDPIFKTYCGSNRNDVLEITINYYENPFCPEDIKKIANHLKETDYDSYLHVYEGNPLNQADMAILSREEVKAAFDRVIDQDGWIEVGADIARYGNDKTIFYKRQGFKTIAVKEYKKKGNMEVGRLLIDFCNKAVPKVDDTGVGGGVTDYLRDYHHPVIPVNFGQNAKQKRKYFNAISEMWFEFKDILPKISLICDDDLFQELTERRWRIDRDGRRRIESKEDFKKRVGRSPDKADALLLCYYNLDINNIEEGELLGV